MNNNFKKEILVLSPHSCFADYIEIQYNSLKKYLKNDFKYVVINDGSDEKNYMNFGVHLKKNITQKCEELNIFMINVPEDLHLNRNSIFPNTSTISDVHPSSRHALSLQYGFSKFINHQGPILILDSDMFLVKEINLYQNILEDYDLIFKMSSSNDLSEYCKINKDIIGYYMWPGFILMNNIPNMDELCFDSGVIFRDDNIKISVHASGHQIFSGYGGDSGANTLHYLQKYKDKLRIIHAKDSYFVNINNNQYIIESDLNLIKYYNNLEKILEKYNVDKGKDIYMNCFMHVGAGSNWVQYGESFYLEIIENLKILIN